MTSTSESIGILEEAQQRAKSLAERLGIERAVFSAPMTGTAGPELVAAVSAAGGLGVLPTGGMTASEIEKAAEKIRSLTDKPFAIQIRIPPKAAHRPQDLHELAEGLAEVLKGLRLPDPLSPEGEAFYDFASTREHETFDERFKAILAAKPAAVISTSGGFREPEAEALFDARIMNIGTATTLREAKVLRAAKADAIICQGAEAAGPRSNFEDSDEVLTGLMSLVPAAARATRLPVIAAGGISEGTQACGALLAGASGVMAGTAFLSTRESLASPYVRNVLIWTTAAHLTLTRLYTGRLVRALRSPLLDALQDYEPRLPAWPAPEALMGPLTEAARRQGREELEAVYLGQSAGRSSWRTAREAVEALSKYF